MVNWIVNTLFTINVYKIKILNEQKQKTKVYGNLTCNLEERVFQFSCQGIPHYKSSNYFNIHFL